MSDSVGKEHALSKLKSANLGKMHAENAIEAGRPLP
jgi:hypothetical protein